MVHPLADRYASKSMQTNFSPHRKYGGWRRLWTSLAEAEYEQGLDAIKPDMIEDMRAHLDDFDLKRAREIEMETQHDIMAHIRHYGEQAPVAKGIIHLGGTSMCITDNEELKTMQNALELVRDKTVNCIHLAGLQAEKHRDLACLGYTHLQPAEPLTVGRRAAQWGYELSLALADIDYRLQGFRGRGAKGATGTQASYLKLFGGDTEKVRKMDEAFAKKAGFTSTFLLTTQTYPRLFDHQILSTLATLAIPVHKTGEDICILQSWGELEEPFKEKQTGSSAMPYKRNPKNTERMKAIARYVMGREEEIATTAAVQKLERTLDDSAIRRIDIPDAFYGADAMLELYMLVMGGLVVYPKVVERRLRDAMPFISAGTFIMEAVRNGGDRQYVHEKIRTHSMEVVENMRNGGENDLLERIAKDPEIPLSEEQIDGIMARSSEFIGNSQKQVDMFLSGIVEPLRKAYPSALELKSSVDI